MVLILDRSSETGANVRSNLICLRHLTSSRVVKNLFFLHMCVTSTALPSDISTMGCRERILTLFTLQASQSVIERVGESSSQGGYFARSDKYNEKNT